MILDGKGIKKIILDELKDKVAKVDSKINFAVIQVGNNEASNVYIKQKKMMAEYIGYGFNHIKLDEATSMEEMLNLIDKLNNDNDIHGIMVQMPLPHHMDISIIQNAVSSIKDIDGLSDLNNGKLFHERDALYSCTPYGVMELLKRYEIDVAGMHAVVVGKSNLVGKPMSVMLMDAGATVTVCHSRTKEIAKYTRMADILVVATGRPKLITEEMVKDGAIVIDVGITRTETGLCGDVDFDNVRNKAKYITPVPGGVGPMTVAMLATNIYKAYLMQNN